MTVPSLGQKPKIQALRNFAIASPPLEPAEEHKQLSARNQEIRRTLGLTAGKSLVKYFRATKNNLRKGHDTWMFKNSESAQRMLEEGVQNSRRITDLVLMMKVNKGNGELKKLTLSDRFMRKARDILPPHMFSAIYNAAKTKPEDTTHE